MSNINEIFSRVAATLAQVTRGINSLNHQQRSMQNRSCEEELSDSEIARIEQERLFLEDPIDVSMSTLTNSSVLSDQELAARLQAEEYSKPSFAIHRSRPNSSTPHRPIRQSPNDETIAARLQAQEERMQQRRNIRQQRRVPVERIVLPPELQLSDGIQVHPGDFTPNDYERLLQLGGEPEAPRLNDDQIARFPTERFLLRANQTEQDTTCSVCWDKYATDDILRRLPCLHTFHRDCIDPWLRTKSQCPICRVDPNQR